MDFRPLNTEERRQLINALRGNAESDRAILWIAAIPLSRAVPTRSPMRRSSAPSNRYPVTINLEAACGTWPRFGQARKRHFPGEVSRREPSRK